MLSSGLPQMIFWAGVAQLVLALASIAIPRLLKWREALQPVSPLIRSIFFTYAVYIFAINVWFGVISVVMPHALTDASGLATSVTLFIALYWWGRVGIQFIFGRAGGRPEGSLFALGEIALWALFIFLALVYTAAAWHNLGVS